MNPLLEIIDSVFADTVYAVTRIIFGEHDSCNPVLRNIVREALLHRGVHDSITRAVEKVAKQDYDQSAYTETILGELK